jgi:hypothetical protein
MAKLRFTVSQESAPKGNGQIQKKKFKAQKKRPTCESSKTAIVI